MASVNLVHKKGTKNVTLPYQVNIYTVWETTDLKLVKNIIEKDDPNHLVNIKYYFESGNSFADIFKETIHLAFNVTELTQIPTLPDHSFKIYSCQKDAQGDWIETEEGSIKTNEIPEGE